MAIKINEKKEDINCIAQVINDDDYDDVKSCDDDDDDDKESN